MVYFDSGLGEDKPKSPMAGYTAIALAVVFGILSVVLYFVDVPAGSAVFGAAGLVLGGFSFGKAYVLGGSRRNLLMGAVGAALLLSVVGFMLGFAKLLG